MEDGEGGYKYPDILREMLHQEPPTKESTPLAVPGSDENPLSPAAIRNSMDADRENRRRDKERQDYPTQDDPNRTPTKETVLEPPPAQPDQTRTDWE